MIRRRWLRDGKLYIDTLLSRNAGPLYLIHFLTLRCQAACRYCFVPINTGKNELTLPEIRKFASKCPPLLYAALTGGEPLLREDFAEIVEAYRSGPNPLIIHANTNGAMPDRAEEAVRKICPQLHESVFSIAVSIDGAEEEHDRIRGRQGLFRKAMATIRRLTALESIFANFRAEINVTLTPDRMPRSLALMDEIRRSAGTNNIFFTVERKNFGAGGSPGISPIHYAQASASAERFFMRRGALATLFRAMTATRNRLILDILRRQRMQVPCLAGRAAGVLWDDGTVFACELRRAPLGSLRERGYALEPIWKSAAASDMVGRIRSERCFCTHECFNTVNAAFRPSLLIRNALAP